MPVSLPQAPPGYSQRDQDLTRRLIELVLNATPEGAGAGGSGSFAPVITSAASGDMLRYDGVNWVNSAFLKHLGTAVVIGTDIGGAEHLRVEGSVSIGGASVYAVAGISALYRSGGWVRLGNDGSSWFTTGKTGDPSNYYDADQHIWRTKDAAATVAFLDVTLGLRPAVAGLLLGSVALPWGVTHLNDTLFGTLGTITADKKLIDHSVTWNAAAVFTGWKLNVTNTLSSAGSKMIDVQVGGVARIAVQPATGGSTPLLLLTPGNNTPGLGITANYVTGAGSSESVLAITANMNTTGNPSLVYINAVDVGGAGASTQLFRVARGGATQFAVLWEGNVGIAGGAVSDALVRIGTGTVPANITDGLQVNTTLTATGGLSHRVVNVLGGGAAGTYTTPVVTGLQLGAYTKAAGQTITTWYGLDILAGPAAGTKWSLRAAEDVWVKGNLVVDGTITGFVGIGSHSHAASDITSGTLGVTRGGTGVSDPTSGNLLVGAGASAMTLLAPGAAGGFVRSDGATWARSALLAGDLPAHTHAETDITDGTLLARLAANETITGAWTFAPSATATAIAVTQAVGAKGIVIEGGTQTTEQYVLHLKQTWNNAGMTFRALRVDITDSASQAQSFFLSCAVGGVPKASLTKTGFLNLQDGLSAAGTITSDPPVNTKAFVAGPQTHTASAPMLDLAQTWNASAVAFTGIKLNITNTASNVGSLLLETQVGGVARFVVGRDGWATIGGNAGSTFALFIDWASIQARVGSDITGLVISGPSVTTDVSALEATMTWNASGVAFKAAKINVTNTASAAGARLLDLMVSLTSKAAWDKDGFFYVQATKVVGSRVTGYTAMTGTADRATSYATSTITLQQLAERVKALQDDLTTHGLIGA